MKLKIALYIFSFFLFGFLLAATNTSAQTIAYRQTNLASDVSQKANIFNPALKNPWGMTFQPAQAFVIANNGNEGVIALDATGSNASSPRFGVLGHPTAIVAAPAGAFTAQGLLIQYVVGSEEGIVFAWGLDARGDIPSLAVAAVDNSANGAVYDGAVILSPACCQIYLAVANFHSGFVEPYNLSFAPLAPPGSFTDPSLPPGYAPFGVQLVGNQIFVTYAVQDAAKKNPVFGAGNGVVDIFDLEGNFVKRFATGGPLNAPWGVTQASANFGPFSNDILIGNVGDGTINAFDLTTGNFVGQIKDGDGNAIVNSGLHALTFRSDGVGDPNTLYFTTGINNGQNGLFGAITTGLVSTTRVSVPTTPTNTSARITVNVSAGPGNLGTPTGRVALQDAGIPISDATLLNGTILFDDILTGVGTHIIEARYTGDANFLPSSSQVEVQVTGPSTMVNLAAPANATPGSPVTLTATIHSPGGTPTGNIIFHDGNTILGTAPLNAAGVATLTISTLAAGTHTVTADYAGDGTFGGSTSAAVTITIAKKDFSLGATPGSATVIAGQSAQFMLTITPAGGFADNVTFSCAPINGITCAFNPAMVTPVNGAASTTLTVSASASVPRYGLLPLSLIGPASLLAALALFSLVLWRGGNLRSGRLSLLTATAVLAIAGLSLTLGGCGGYGNSAQPNRGTASVMVTAQSGAISHSASVAVTVQ